MKILLIRPKPPVHTIGLKHVMICEPLELEYIISNVSSEVADQVQMVIYDFIVEKESYLSILRREKPDMVFFTGYITHINIIKSMARAYKSEFPNGLAGVGGVHAEVVGDDFEDEGIDYIFRKNAIDGFNSLLEGMLKGYSREQIISEIKANEDKELRFDYKHPARASVSRYRDKYYYMFHNPCALIKTSYGCPYNCRFCFCKEITGGRYYARDIGDVVDEIEGILEDEIYIVDDDFLFDPDRLNNFIKLLKDRNINKRYLVYGRADFVASNLDILKEFRDVGLRAVIVGIESIRGNDLDNYNKSTTVEINEKCIDVLGKLDIELYATLILPMDFSKEDFADMTRWLVNKGVTFVNLQPLTPLPGTEIYKEYESKLLVSRDNFEKFDMAHVVLNPSKMSVRSFYFQILKSYYKIVLRPKNTVRLLKKYGLKENIKMLLGSQKVSWQYLLKIIKG